MKERPVLFNGAMVRALLDGSKTQTRRVVKPQPDFVGAMGNPHVPWKTRAPGLHVFINCPYGQPGDRLWVRETFVQGHPYDAVTDRLLQWDADGNELAKKTWYRADRDGIGWSGDDGWEVNTPWKPSIHMPRAASRISLEITSVRVERLQDISETDAKAEGSDALIADDCTPEDLALLDVPLSEVSNHHRNGFALLWESINGDGSWVTNPWVWAVQFKRLTLEGGAA